ncbi:A-type potassium channel modulatory protein KCNIP1-like isoform X1 [Centruroides vittatus]|uniref:A-type potassium channel modulatory protein KCNIP1-like isoform X1 n=1 Tax=Centruroides vittatus TaxID=120091 RepID=UPI003510420C
MTSIKNIKQIRYNLVDMTEKDIPNCRREGSCKAPMDERQTGLYRRLLHMFRRAWSGIRDHDSEEISEPVIRRKPAGIDALCKTTKFNRKELKFMYQGFKQACPTGIVNESTLKDIYAQFFPQGDASQYAHYVFKAFDQDRNGTITFQDFVVGLSTLLRGTTVEKLQWVFHLYDLDGDGTITKEEMAHIIESIHNLMGEYAAPSIDGESTRSHAERVFQKLDLNKDGVVTRDMFVETCLKDDNILKSLQLLDTVL